MVLQNVKGLAFKNVCINNVKVDDKLSLGLFELSLKLFAMKLI